MYTLVLKFVQAVGETAQIVNLGAGFDTMFWRLKGAGVQFKSFHELDLDDVVTKKRALIQQYRGGAGGAGGEGGEGAPSKLAALASNGQYHLDSADLRDPSSVTEVLAKGGIDTGCPTLFLTECVLCYVDNEDSERLLTALAGTFATAVFANYEMINPADPFGQVMVRNLEMRGCPLKGLKGCPDMAAQQARLQKAGWEVTQVMTMSDVYGRLGDDTIKRVAKLEIFDEFEEWNLIMGHYCMAVAHKAPPGSKLDLQQVAL